MADANPYAKRDLKKEASSWLTKLEAAQKRQTDWEDDARDAEHAYSAGMRMSGEDKSHGGKIYDFNIVHSNVETIVPAIYNSTAVPDIRPRWAGEAEDPSVKASKELGAALERAISVMVDDNRMDKEIESGARDAYLSGRDIVRIRFDADEQEIPADPAMMMIDEFGEMIEAEPQTIMVNERITFEAVSWRDFRMGPARRWEDVPFVAFAHRIAAEALEEFEDGDMLKEQRTGEYVANGDDGDDVTIWEVWCKNSRTVKWIKENGSEIIREDEDPLGLPGFFPIHEPVQPIGLTGQMTPVCPAKIYKKLADEVDTITKRIERITSGLKVRGIIIGDATDIMELSALNDWELAPASSSLEALAHTGNIENAIAWWPIDKAVAVLKILYEAREQSKQSIYEITGISDIVRGASAASETATAQQIKTQWGSLRIQRMQKLIERQVRDIFVMMVDVMARHFRPERIQELAGVQLGPEALALLQQPVQAHYRIDVESDSTIRADLTRAKGEMTEFLNGTGQFFGTMAPVIEKDPALAGPVTEIYASFARVFRLGKQAEDAIDEMAGMATQAASQPRPNPEAEKLKAEMEAKQAELQARLQEGQQSAQMKMQELQAKIAGDAAKLGLEREMAEANLAIKQVELQIEQIKLELEERKLIVSAANADADRDMQREQFSKAAKDKEAA